MIPFNFEYYQPETIKEALQTVRELKHQAKTALFYSGGTEFITLSRINQLAVNAVIDVKRIPELQVFEIRDHELIIGAGVTLNKISESTLFPLLGQAVKGIADHTSRNKITVGGNLNSRLMYREAILPLLVTDAKLKIAGSEGEIILPLKEIYDKGLKLADEQVLVQIMVNENYLNNPFIHIKRTKFSKIGYPIVSISALVMNDQIKAALSGVCDFPFRSMEMEAILNDDSISFEERIEQAVLKLPAPILADIQASREYREFVLKNALLDTLDALKEATS